MFLSCNGMRTLDTMVRDMKVGDLIAFSFNKFKDKYAGNKDTKVYWSDSEVMTEKSKELEVISESR